MAKKNKYKPYIKIANGKERSDSFRTAIRLKFLELSFKKFYVIVQHGFPKDVMVAARTKEELKNSILVVSARIIKFNVWANNMKHIARRRECLAKELKTK